MPSPRSELTFTAVHMTMGILAIVAAIVATILFVRPDASSQAPVVVPSSVVDAADKRVATEVTDVDQATKPISGKPVEIIVPALNMSVPITDGYYNANTQTWTLGPKSAYFATMSQPANNRDGTTFVYGHNTKAVFHALYGLRGGETAMVRTDSGAVFYYVFTGAHDVKPTETSVLNEPGAPKLVVQTCSGAWDQNRRLFTFKFVRVRTS